MPHPNSLMYNVYAIPFWPMKVYWTLKKVIPPSLILIGSDNCVDPGLPHSPWEPPRCQDLQGLLHHSRTSSLNVIMRKAAEHGLSDFITLSHSLFRGGCNATHVAWAARTQDSEESERDIFNSFIKDRQILFSIIKGLQSYVSLEDRT